MKLTLLCFYLTLLNVFVSVYSQTTKLTINLKNTTVYEIFKIIEDQTDYKFLYHDALIENAKPITVNFKDLTVEQILDELFNNSENTYTLLENNLVVITPKLKPFKQELTITGKITDAIGTPLSGAGIFIKGTNDGVISDLNGNFKIPVPSDNCILIFSMIGYFDKEIQVGSQRKFTVFLDENIESLAEVVVIGYGTVKKSDLTGAVTTVTSEQLKDKPVATLDLALQGKVPGMEIISNSGSPGAITAIRIRGTGTITNSDPIFVIDGLIMDPIAVNFLNPSDIESISILKDASATAIYGSKGANGVIMVTTKKGKKGETKVDFNTYYGTQKAVHWMDLMSGPEWAATKHMANSRNPAYNPDTTTSTNWFKEVTRTAPIYCANLSLSKGTDDASYYVAFGYFNQDGIIKRTNYNRYTFRLNSDISPRRWLKIGENFQAAISKRNFVEESSWYNGAIARAMQADPITPIRTDNGQYAPQIDGRGNPVARMNKGLLDQTSKETKMVGNLFTEILFLRGLTFKTAFGCDFGVNDYYSFTPAYNFGVGDSRQNSTLSQSFGKNLTWQWDNYLTYQKVFGIHDVTIVTGSSACEFHYYDLSGYNSSYPGIAPEEERYFNTFPRGVNNEDVLGGGANQNAQFSMYGRMNYKLLDKYLLTATLRYDGSSKFGEDYRFGTFPSFALAWKVNNEDFMKDLKFISTFKIHGGWGKTGNDKIGDWQYTGTVTRNLNYSQGTTLRRGATTLRPPNPQIKWETDIQTNVGFDAGFFGNKVLLNAEYFVRNTKDMLCTVVTPLTSGIPAAQAPTLNIGKVLNKGIEVTASYRKIEGDFRYEIGAFVSKIVNKVIDLGGEDVRIIPSTVYGQSVSTLSVTQEGQPIASFYGYITEGVFQSYEEVNAHAHQSNFTQPGDFKFKDINGDGIIDTDDQTFIGSPHPKFTYGGNLSLGYKFLDFSITLQGVKGVDIFTPYKSYINNALSPDWNLSSDLLNAWTPENHSNTIPRIGTTDPNLNRRASTYYIEDGSYMRIKTAQLGVTLPEKLVKKMNLTSLRIYFGAQNLFTFTKYKGNDPEIGLSQRNANNYNNLDAMSQLIINVDVGTTPQPRVFTFGFDVRL